MKLLYCSRDYTTHDLRFVSAIVRGGFDVGYLRLQSDGVVYTGEPLPEGAAFIEWEGGKGPLTAREAVERYVDDFARVVRETKADVIHVGPVQSFGTIAGLTRLAPAVLVSWGSDVLVDSHRDEWHEWATRTAVQSASGIVCDSKAVLEQLRVFNGGELPPSVCVPWGPESLPDETETRTTRQKVRHDLGLEDNVVVIAARAWQRGYRVPELVEAFASAARSVPTLRLILAGDGEEAEEIDRIIRDRSIGESVIRTGMVGAARLHELLAASDIYLSLVPSDGTSISLLDAMAHRLACIVADNPGNREWISDGTTGVLVATEDPVVWGERVANLALDPAKREKAGANAEQVVRARADWQKNSAQIVELYRRLVNTHASLAQ